jgi:hypothetical protein
MTKEGAGPRQDAESGRSDAGPDKVVPEGRGDVHGISDLTYRIITPYLRHDQLHRACLVVLVVLAAVCLIGSVARLSPFPVIPLPLLGAAYFALRRSRLAMGDRGLLVWFSVFLAGALIAFWLMSFIGARLR